MRSAARTGGLFIDIHIATTRTAKLCQFYPAESKPKDERMTRATRYLRSIPAWAISAIAFVTIAGVLTIHDSPRAIGQESSSDATLSALTLSDVNFGTFASSTESYTASVSYSVSQTTVTPTVNHSGASYVVRLGGVTDADGTVSLAVGGNVITDRGNRRGRKHNQDLHRHRYARGSLLSRLSRPSESQRHRT